LLDTYDTEAAAHKVVKLAPGLAADGIRIRAVRLDSGDLIALSKRVRRILDEGGLAEVMIFVSGGLDEDDLLEVAAAGAPIDGFGIGTSLTTSSDAPALDCVYKMQEYAAAPRRKRSVGKATWPGRKQVWRHHAAAGRMSGDVLSLEEDTQPGEPLLKLVMRNGRRIEPPKSLADIRPCAARNLVCLPDDLRELRPGTSYPVAVAEPLKRLAADVDRRLAQQELAEP
jgi:nicotinate phosphoribosyltransferase